MGITELLTIIFVVLKLLGIISWSWWLVLLPEIIAGIFYLAILVVVVVIEVGTVKELKNFNDDFSKRFFEEE